MSDTREDLADAEQWVAEAEEKTALHGARDAHRHHLQRVRDYFGIGAD